MTFFSVGAIALVATLGLAAPQDTPAQSSCDAECMFDLTKAFAAFGVEKAARMHVDHDPGLTVLDTWAQERVPPTQRGRTTAALQAIGRDLGISVANHRQHPGWLRCMEEDYTSPACRAHHGRTFITLMSLRIPEPGYAVARVSVTTLRGERGFYTNSSDVLMKRVDGEWRPIAEDNFIVG